VAALLVWAAKSDSFSEPRLVILITFVIFLVIVSVLRLGLLDRMYVASISRHPSACVLVGDSPAAERLFGRLSRLRGFDGVIRATPESLCLGLPRALEASLDDGPRTRDHAASIFVDASSAPAREVFEAIALGLARGADVYAVSKLIGPLECNRVLSTIFEAPVSRVRRRLEDAKPYPLKRAFDIAGSACLILICLPVIAVLGVIIRLTSPGPVFFAQTRVGGSGGSFEFLKLRSMLVNDDASSHSEYVKAFMKGAAEAKALTVDGDAVFKMVDDPRITPIGRFIRKYSLDELPQFWNVLRGDMGLVGPRPPLPYEVSEYDTWDSLRMSVPGGVTGLWQIAGRSRVSFDEMILQDLMYAQNMRLLVDAKLCLGTIRAMLLGSGGG
jgi:lipopolysaccharide/colanic/teichoic acid biosynthesis glycosyltransferase